MEPLYDNLKFIQSQYGEKDKEAKLILFRMKSWWWLHLPTSEEEVSPMFSSLLTRRR